MKNQSIEKFKMKILDCGIRGHHSWSKVMVLLISESWKCKNWNFLQELLCLKNNWLHANGTQFLLNAVKPLDHIAFLQKVLKIIWPSSLKLVPSSSSEAKKERLYPINLYQLFLEWRKCYNLDGGQSWHSLFEILCYFGYTSAFFYYPSPPLIIALRFWCLSPFLFQKFKLWFSCHQIIPPTTALFQSPNFPGSFSFLSWTLYWLPSSLSPLFLSRFLILGDVSACRAVLLKILSALWTVTSICSEEFMPGVHVNHPWH